MLKKKKRFDTGKIKRQRLKGYYHFHPINKERKKRKKKNCAKKKKGNGEYHLFPSEFWQK